MSRNELDPNSDEGLPARLKCVTESVYSGQLTRGNVYDIAQVGKTARQYRMKNDQGQLKWYPAYCFADESIAVRRLVSFRIDDEITDSSSETVEVTFTLSDGSLRWCAFTIPASIAALWAPISAGEQRFHALSGMPNLIIVSELSEGVIGAVPEHLDKQGDLEECSAAFE